ncbi:MAG: dihydropteroate synthase [Verrucomicrobiota bacterium]
MIFRAAAFEFRFPRPTLIMGIVNVTPDSFSDGGRYFDSVAAVQHGRELVSEGADIIDVGGESTRPNAKPVTEVEELRRVLPVIEQLARQVKVPISIDTQKPMVARAALLAGASIVNDIAANRKDGEMWQVVAQTGAGYVAMHMQGRPETMQIKPVYQDVVREVEEFFSDRLRRLEQAGVPGERVILDAGFGFGKTLDHNLELLAALKRFTRFQRPLLLGVSRKSFISKLFGLEMEERLPAALACSCWAVHSGVQVVRTHDVSATVRALRMTEAILARSKT